MRPRRPSTTSSRSGAQQVLDQVEKEGNFAVVLASRPYQNDALVNHELPEHLYRHGHPGAHRRLRPRGGGPGI